MSNDFWHALRLLTPARIGLGRHGNGLPTGVVLAAGAAHAAARAAVHQPLDVDRLVHALARLALEGPVLVASAAADRTQYLTRPDLGRQPGSELPEGDPVDLAIVVADGLSAMAVQRHSTPLLLEILSQIQDRMTIAPIIVATQARVALGDHIGAALQARMVLVLIGERPGLSCHDSLGAYLTWAPRPGVVDAARNCVSNIGPPHGLDYATAARTLTALMSGARLLGGTGVHLKDGGDELMV